MLSSPLEALSVPLPIPQAARQAAAAFARQQPTPAKAAQVRRNTIAVWVMNEYLQMMGVSTDLAASDSWNPVVQLGADVADLLLPNLGRLECRPVAACDRVCLVPPEVWDDRIGYVVIQVDEALDTASWLGFVGSVAVEELPLQRLRSPETLFEHLAQLQAEPIHLAEWLNNQFTSVWQAVDAVLNPPRFEFAFRRLTIARARQVQVGGCTLALVVDIRRAAAEMSILLQVHPVNAAQLPADVRLDVLDERGEVVEGSAARSGEVDRLIQLQLSGAEGERFQVRVSFNSDSFSEIFVI